MFGYVVNGVVIPHNPPLANGPFPNITTYFSDGTEKSHAILKKISVRKKKRKEEDAILIEIPRYRIVFKSGERPAKYLWDVIEVSNYLTNTIFSTLDVYVSSTKIEDAPKIKLEGRDLSTYLLNVEILFGYLELLESKSNAPVTILEKLLRYTVYLSSETPEWDELATIAGFDSITYEPEYDVVTIHLNGSQYSIQRKLLKLFAEQVAPIVTKLLYRSTRLWVGETPVSLCELYYIKKNLEDQVEITAFKKDFKGTEEILREIHQACGTSCLMSHSKPLLEAI